MGISDQKIVVSCEKEEEEKEQALWMEGTGQTRMVMMMFRVA